jgi:predicted MPP superfamily phosphohydrolase
MRYFSAEQLHGYLNLDYWAIISATGALPLTNALSYWIIPKYGRVNSGGFVTRFLIIYLVFYGGAHAYFYLKLWLAFPLKRRNTLLLAIPLILLFLAPLLARTLEKHDLGPAAGAASFIGYWWMGLIFLFVCAALLLDLINLLLCGARSLLKTGRPRLIPPALAIVIPALYAITIAAYGWQEARTIRTEEITVTTPKIPAAVGRVRIVQISDVHAGQIVREKRIREILRVVSAASPDLLISTGDLVDGHQRHFKGLEPLFRGIAPPLGKFAVTGNHEYYVGIESAVKFTQDAGFKVLMDENASIGGYLTLTGIADPGRATRDPAREAVERALLATADQQQFILLLKHRPDLVVDCRGKFDLQLSGHVHKGQIFPFNVITWLAYPLHTGLTDLGNDSRIYVSRGTGVWGPPIRFLAPPEVTVINLVAAQKTFR